MSYLLNEYWAIVCVCAPVCVLYIDMYDLLCNIIQI